MLQRNVRQPVYDTADVAIVDNASIGESDVEVGAIDADGVFPFRGGRQHLGVTSSNGCNPRARKPWQAQRADASWDEQIISHIVALVFCEDRRRTRPSSHVVPNRSEIRVYLRFLTWVSSCRLLWLHRHRRRRH
jgi:hypothetical protein